MSEVEDKGNAMFPTPGHRLEFIAKVRLLGVVEIRCEFSGSGDSGNIEDPQFYDRNEVEIGDKVNDQVLAWPSEESKWDARTMSWVKEHHEASDRPLKEIVASMCETGLDSAGLDWYNNDGGQGSFTFKFTDSGMDVDLRVGVNHTETSEYNFEF